VSCNQWEERNTGEEEEQCREEATSTAAPEGDERYLTRFAMFLQKQRSNQKARDDKEEINTKKAAPSHAKIEVIRHHAQDGQGSKPIKPSKVLVT